MQDELRKRLEAIAPTDNSPLNNSYISGYRTCVAEFIDVIMKDARIVYVNLKDKCLCDEVHEPGDTHIAVVFDFKPIEPPDSMDKLIEDLANYHDTGDVWSTLIERAKKLMNK